MTDSIFQCRLLTEKELLKTALELAQGMELSTRNVIVLNVPTQELPSTTGPTVEAQISVH